MPVGVKLEEFSQDEPMETWPFRELIGSLTWLTTQTRLDIANSVRGRCEVLRWTQRGTLEDILRYFSVRLETEWIR